MSQQLLSRYFGGGAKGEAPKSPKVVKKEDPIQSSQDNTPTSRSLIDSGDGGLFSQTQSISSSSTSSSSFINDEEETTTPVGSKRLRRSSSRSSSQISQPSPKRKRSKKLSDDEDDDDDDFVAPDSPHDDEEDAIFSDQAESPLFDDSEEDEDKKTRRKNTKAKPQQKKVSASQKTTSSSSSFTASFSFPKTVTTTSSQTPKIKGVEALSRFMLPGSGTKTPSSTPEEKGSQGKMTPKKNAPAPKVKLTPLEQFVADTWEKYPGVFLAVQCGYKFRFFGRDAEVASRVLNIICTSGKGNFASASIPIPRLPFHLRRLVRSGLKVGVVRQTETTALKAASANKNAPYERALTEIYTRATLIAEEIDPYETKDQVKVKPAIAFPKASSSSVLSDSEAEDDSPPDPTEIQLDIDASSDVSEAQLNSGDYILCLSESPAGSSSAPAFDVSMLKKKKKETETTEDETKNIDLNWIAIQPSTGDIVWDQHTDDYLRSGLSTRLTQLRPCEIILPPKLSASTESAIQHYCHRIGARMVSSDDPSSSVGPLPSDDLDLTSSTNIFEVVRIERVDEFHPDRAFQSLSDLFRPNKSSSSSSSMEDQGSEDDQLHQKNAPSLLNLPKDVRTCAGVLLDYLKQFDLEDVLRLHRNLRSFSSTTSMALGSTALKHLEILQCLETGKTKGSLLWVLDHTATSFGHRLLRRWICQPLFDPTEIASRQDAVDQLIQIQSSSSNQSPEARKACEHAHSFLLNIKQKLEVVGDLERGLLRAYHKKCSPKEFCSLLISFRQLLETVFPPSICQAIIALHRNKSDEKTMAQTLNEIQRQLQDELKILFPESEMLRGCMSSIPLDLLGVIDELLAPISIPAARDNNKSELFESNEEQFPEIVKARNVMDSARQQLQAQLPLVRKVLGLPSLQYVDRVGSGEFLIELTVAQAKKAPAEWIPMNGTIKLKRFHTPQIAALVQKLNEGKELLVLASNAAWNKFLLFFEGHYYRFRTAVSCFATLDCLFSLTTVAVRNRYVKPVIHNDELNPHHILIEGGRHPIVEHIVSDPFVPNDTQMSKDRKAYVLTGPNMGGKSCYIRQIGSYVPAEKATIRPVDRIMVRMGAQDNVDEKKSTFFVEMQETSDILGSATDRSLVILDELGRGTSTHDGASIAWATLYHCVRSIGCCTLFVTHYHLLCDSLVSEFPHRIFNCHMSFFEEKDQLDPDQPKSSKVTFLYKITEGMAHRSFGLNVARLAGLPNSILQKASVKSHEMESRMVHNHQLNLLCGSLFSPLQSSQSSQSRSPAFETISNLQNTLRILRLNSSN